MCRCPYNTAPQDWVPKEFETPPDPSICTHFLLQAPSSIITYPCTQLQLVTISLSASFFTFVPFLLPDRSVPQLTHSAVTPPAAVCVLVSSPYPQPSAPALFLALLHISPRAFASAALEAVIFAPDYSSDLRSNCVAPCQQEQCLTTRSPRHNGQPLRWRRL